MAEESEEKARLPEKEDGELRAPSSRAMSRTSGNVVGGIMLAAEMTGATIRTAWEAQTPSTALAEAEEEVEEAETEATATVMEVNPRAAAAATNAARMVTSQENAQAPATTAEAAKATAVELVVAEMAVLATEAPEPATTAAAKVT